MQLRLKIMNNLTILIPLCKYDDAVKKYLANAINSVGDETTVISGPADVIKDVKKDYKQKNLSFVEREETGFCNQVNDFVSSCKTKYFSILEVDDNYTPIAFKFFDTYTKNYPDFFAFLPLTEIIDAEHEEEGPVGYINEAVWANSFSEEIGFLDMDSTMSYLNFNFTGAIFKTEDFKELGMLKPSLKFAFWHEFILRALFNKKQVFVIPRVCYNHRINRKDSLYDELNKTMSAKESNWWVDLAQKEYFFKRERDISKYTYEE